MCLWSESAPHGAAPPPDTRVSRPTLFRAEDVSVVMPAYNHESFVGAALASVQEQSLLPRDFVVVDDGSTDRTAEVIASAEIPHLSLLRQENQGAHVALNRAIAVAAGRWVAILNSDDAYEPRHLERALGVGQEGTRRWSSAG